MIFGLGVWGVLRVHEWLLFDVIDVDTGVVLIWRADTVGAGHAAPAKSELKTKNDLTSWTNCNGGLYRHLCLADTKLNTHNQTGARLPIIAANTSCNNSDYDDDDDKAKKWKQTQQGNERVLSRPVTARAPIDSR